ncbi:acetyltransferase [Xylariaceae sp. AK1471]|nr:acetyltransferase [Xylariaceae sp. AK1471]
MTSPIIVITTSTISTNTTNSKQPTKQSTQQMMPNTNHNQRTKREMMGTPFIARLGPTSLEEYDSTLPPDQQTSPYIPPIFKDVISVREAAFAEEQQWWARYDDDDARSCHWVMYASVNTTTEPEERDPDTDAVIRPRRSVTRSLPIGTLRIVPFPHPPHPKDGARYVGNVLQPADGDGVGGGSSSSKDSGAAQGSKTDRTQPPRSQALSTVVERRRTWAMAFKPDRKTDFHDGKEPYVKLERVAVVPEFRHHHRIPVELWDAAKNWLQENPTSFDPSIRELGMNLTMGASTYDIPRWNGLVCLHAQEHLVEVYERWGFRVDKGMGRWYEEGIPHVGMFQRLKVKYVFPL